MGCAKLPKKVTSRRHSPPTAEQMAELWVDPADPTSRDLLHGPGGPELMPSRAPRSVSSPRTRKATAGAGEVVDEQGMEWSVKYGPEAHSEVFASRIVWAPATIKRRPTTWRTGPHGRSRAGPQAALAVPARADRTVAARDLAWHDSPFVGTQPYRGLLVLMRVLNNWDLLDRNNAIFELAQPVEGAARWYVVIDLGAALGRTRSCPFPAPGATSRTSRPRGTSRGGRQGPGALRRPGPVPPRAFQDLTPADVRWTSERLSRLTQSSGTTPTARPGTRPKTRNGSIAGSRRRSPRDWPWAASHAEQ